MFRNSLFSINLLMGFLVFVVTAGFFILPFFLQLVKGYETEKVGLLMMTNPIVTGLIAPIAGTLSDRYGSRVISLIGLCLVVVGCLTLSTLNTSVNEIGFILRYLPVALGFGMFQSPNNNAIVSSAPRERMGVASGLLSLSRTLGQTTGLPLMGALFSALVLAFAGLPAGVDATTAPAQALVTGVNGTFRIAAVIVFISTLLAFAAMQIDSRRKKLG
jgi:MFS family permease